VSSNQTWWYLTRGSGLVAWALLTASMAFGLTLSTRLFGRGVAPAWLLDVHRFLGGLALALVGVHLAALVGDTYVHFTLGDLLVPMSSDWKPAAVAWGVVAFWLLVAVEITSLVMARLPRRFWRAVHEASFACFLATALHGSLAGSDAAGRLWQWGATAAITTVMFLTLVRILATRRAARTPVRRAPIEGVRSA
jgi:DMSO/TMAO reductase YedYZ heme-binding membrane subunit